MQGEPRAAWQVGGGMDRVLVVDDETGIRGLMSQWVEALGCAPVEAPNAEQAVQRMGELECDVAVCDVNLPGRDGLWLARHIRNHHPETAVVLATGIQDIESAVGGLRVGIVDYLLKPFGRERFREALARARDWHRAAEDASRWRLTASLEIETRVQQLGAAVSALGSSSDEAVRGMVALLTIRNRPLYEHVVRVAALAVELGAAAGLRADEAGDLRRAALVHEVTRAVVPETILWKPGELTSAEWDILRREPEAAFTVFSTVPFLAGAACVLRAIRERHDGTGYPHGLSAAEIPMGARILAVSDAYDTMVRPLAHREPLSPTEATREVVDGRGTQFDPFVADLLLERLGHPAR
jgi:putative two-component system response regulator